MGIAWNVGKDPKIRNLGIDPEKMDPELVADRERWHRNKIKAARRKLIKKGKKR